MIEYAVRHETVYSYTSAVSISHSVAHLLPRICDTQELHKVQLRIEPTPSSVHSFDDYFGNPCVFFIVNEPHDRLRVLTESEIGVRSRSPVDLDASPGWDEVARSLRDAADAETLSAYEFVFDSPFVATSALFEEYARESFPAGRPLLAAAGDLCRRIHQEFRYDPEATTLATPVEEVLAQRHGVCQDFAHVMLGSLRSLGIAARYVSGYIRSGSAGREDAEPRGANDEEPLVGADASHAWVSVYCPGVGWVDFDPTNDMVPSDRHVVVGWGRDYDDVSPLQGVTLGGGLQTVRVGVEMRPVEEPP